MQGVDPALARLHPDDRLRRRWIPGFCLFFRASRLLFLVLAPWRGGEAGRNVQKGEEAYGSCS